MTTPIEWELKATGDAAAGAAFDRVRGKIQQTEQAQTRLASSATQVAQRMGTLGSTMSLAAGGIGRFNQGAGQMVAIVGQSTGAIAAMAGAMGPWGIAIAIATTAFGLLSSAMAESKTETDRATQSVRQHAAAVREALPSLQQYASAIQAGLAETARHRRVQAGLGSVVEHRAELEALRGDLERVIATHGPGSESAAEFLQAQIENAESRLEAARTRAREKGLGAEDVPGQFSGGNFGTRRSGGGGRSRPSGARGEDPVAGLIADARARQRADLERGMGGEGDLGSFLQEQSAAFSEWQEMGRRAEATEQRLVESARSAARDFADAWKEGVDAVIEAYETANEAARVAGEEQISAGRLMGEAARATGQQVLQHIGGVATDALRANVSAWIDGSKSGIQAAKDFAKGVIQALVSESVVQALVETARGFAALASYRYDAAGAHFTSAGIWAAVGVGAGVVGAATGALGGGRGRGASGGGDRFRGVDSPRLGDGGGGGVNLTLVVQAPIENPEALGMFLIGPIRSAMRTQGHAARLTD